MALHSEIKPSSSNGSASKNVGLTEHVLKYEEADEMFKPKIESNADEDQQQQQQQLEEEEKPQPKSRKVLESVAEKIKPPPVWATMTWLERLWFFFVKVPIRAVWCVTNILVFFCVYFGYMLPVLWARKLWPRLYWGYEGKLYRWMQAFIGYWGYSAGYDVFEYGDDVSELGEKGRVLVMVNHQSTADVPTLMAVLQSKGVACRKALWLMDRMFRWTPFGIIGHNHGDYFIMQGKDTRDKEIDNLKRHLRKVFWDRDRRWVILFPEGGFYYKRVESSQRYAEKHNFPHLEHTTLPRMGAVKAILEAVGPRPIDTDNEHENNGNGGGEVRQRANAVKILKDTVGAIREKKYVKETMPPIKHVLDITIAYPDGYPLGLDTWGLGTRAKCDIAVNYKIHKAQNVPFHDDDLLRDWMYDRYVEKDRILDTYYREGVFHVGEVGNRVYFPWYKIVGQYSFWFASAYGQYKLYYWLLTKAVELINLAIF